LSAHLIKVKLLSVTFYFNGGLHAASVGKPSERMSNFWTVRFLKTVSEPNFGYLHIPSSGQLSLLPSARQEMGSSYGYGMKA